jgi:Asp-tRNA(Asn)/Glu-tRNA(Gln) amidotransferase A subunit family amidase
MGTQTIGSVIRPAAYCGIVGYKPTFERIPCDGLVRFSRSVDHVGLFTQDLAGMVMAASAVCDGWRVGAPTGEAPVLGVPEGPYLKQAESEALAAFEASIAALDSAGVVVKRVPAFADIDELNAVHRRMAFAEFSGEHGALFERYGHCLRDRTVEAYEAGRAVGADELAAARLSRLERRQDIEELMALHGIDLWATPAAPGPAPHGLSSTGDPNMNLPWTHAGMPAVTLPAGNASNGLPLGMQLVARYGEDEELLDWADRLSGVGGIGGRG